MDVRAGIPAAELADRRERLLEHVRERGLGGWVLFGADSIRYFTGFNFLATERPSVVGNTAGDLAVFVPEFEVERVRAETSFELVESYPEYPGRTSASPARACAPRARRRRPAGRRRGRLSEHPRLRGAGAERGHGPAGHAGARAVHRAHDGAQERGRGGADPRERAGASTRTGCSRSTRAVRPRRRRACARGTRRRSRCSRRSTAPTAASRPRRTASSPPIAARSARSSWAHAVAHNIEFAEGDVLVTETSAPVWGQRRARAAR